MRKVWRGVITHREEGQTLPCIYKTHPSDEKHLYPLHSIMLSTEALSSLVANIPKGEYGWKFGKKFMQ